MGVSTIGKVFLKQAVPPDLWRDDLVFDKKTAKVFFAELAEKHPDEYAKVLQRLSNLSRVAGTEYGAQASVGLKDLLLGPKAKAYQKEVRAKVHEISQRADLTAEQKNTAILQYMRRILPTVTAKLQEDEGKRNTGLGLQMDKGLRGSPMQYTQLLFGDLLVADHRGRAMPTPGLHGYGEGVLPVEYWAGSYGSRAGFSSVQFATARAGYIGKQMALASQRLKITGEDCGAVGVGLKTDGDDPEIMGAVLARPVAGLAAGHAIEKADLPLLADKKVVLRSPITCQQEEGLCQKCVGRREQGHFPALGAYVGITSARAIAEPLTQELGLCLARGTRVRMADWSMKPIEQIKAGDMVIGCSLTGDGRPVKVLAAYANGRKSCRSYLFKNGTKMPSSVCCTKEHRILCCRTWRSRGRALAFCGPLAAGKCLTDTYAVAFQGYSEKLPGVSEFRRSAMTESRGYKSLGSKVAGRRLTYDIRVDHPAHLFLLANGVIVSNSSKHVGGTVGLNANNIDGFDEINQFLQVPETFRGVSVLAPKDGRITKIVEAPQGGSYVYVDDEQAYVPVGRGVAVKAGQTVEAGDMLSDGTPNPAEIAAHKGLGAGRDYFIRKFGQILKDNGVPTHRRNVETLARAVFDRVRVTEPDGIPGHRVGDVAFYSDVQRTWKPRLGSGEVSLERGKGQYLEQPLLHYTIGTRLTPSIIADLKEEGITKAMTHSDPPPFEPMVTQLRQILGTDPDWKTRMSGFDLKRTFLDAARKGSTSPMKTTSPIPALMDPTRL